jgi:cation diffusion facilitator family transporter
MRRSALSSAVANRDKTSAALTSVIAAIFLTIMKTVIGIMTGSLGILSEAAHSALDLVAAVITLFSVRVSSRPPDKEHPFGHGKIENLSALFETLLLLITCVWIIYEAINRLFFKTVEVEANIWSFLVMGTSIIIDISRSRVLDRAAKKYNSQALEADALHFSTDVWSSAVVIGGLALVLISNVFHVGWLVRADAIAALVVAMIVVYVSLQLGKRTIDGLLDTAPPGVAAAIEDKASSVPGVIHVDEVRVRRSGPGIFADVVVSVSNSLPLEEAQGVADAVEESVRAVSPEADVIVRTDPHDDVENILRQIRMVASRMHLDVHNVSVQEIGGHVYIALDLEVGPDLSLGEAHDLATKLEERLPKSIAGVARIDTHIEPRPQAATRGQDITAQSSDIIAAVQETIKGLPLISGSHSITVLKSDGRYDISVHCTFDKNLSIGDAHHISDTLSQRVRTALPSVNRVIVHPEP